MVFSSLVFLYIFLPLCVAAYFLIPSYKGKNAVLIAFSLIFYAWGEPLYVFLLVGSAAFNYAMGLLLAGQEVNWKRKAVLIGTLVLNLAVLLLFKYVSFFIQVWNDVFQMNVQIPSIVMPIGISFYTFQALSYTVDVYRRQTEHQRSFWRFLLYLSLFPQLIAGPIVRYSDIEQQLEKREYNPENIFYGLMRFSQGLGKKVLLANYAGKAAAQLLEGAGGTLAGMWLGILFYAFEIYFDFSGYSDMAIGLGRIFGFKYAENFNLPYTAFSISDFWRRWHISLSSFFRDYVYIPLGGNRKHRILNLFIVWFLTGFWHGASWNFILWGLYFFVLLSIEKLAKPILEPVPKWVRRLITLPLIVLGWSLFYYTDLNALKEALFVMFGGGELYSETVGFVGMNNALLLVLCVIGSTPVPRKIGLLFGSICAQGEPGQSIRKQRVYAIGVLLFDIAVLAVATVSLVGSSYNPFLYFRF